MKYAEMKQGRVFILKLDNDQLIHEGIQKFAQEKNIKRGIITCIGAAGSGSTVAAGLIIGQDNKTTPISETMGDIYEMYGVGVIYTNNNGNPIAHMHMSFGRGSGTITGCIRQGVKVWNLGEVTIIELIGEDTLLEIQ